MWNHLSFKMEKTTGIMLVIVLLSNLILYSEGLKCYDCKHTESGKIVGYKESNSCKWGTKPNDEFLIDCATLQANEFDFVCAEMRIDGFYRSNPEEKFVGTIRSCAARIITSSQQQQQNATTGENKEIQEFQECKQGNIETVYRNILNPTGKEHLLGFREIFEENSTSVKFCACDKNACWNQQQNVPEAGSDIGGGTSSVRSTIQMIVSVLFLYQFYNRF